MLQPHIAPQWKGKVLLGILTVEGVKIRQRSSPLWDLVEKTCRGLARRYAGQVLSGIEGIAKVRKLYRSFGLDPTKNRPSSEALLRRCLRGIPLKPVNSVVDVCNLCSLRFLLPIGLYDTKKISGAVTFRTGEAGEGYEGIEKGWINLENKILLCDEKGPFGNPSSDSERTKITLETTAAGMVLFAPPSFSRGLLEEHLGEAAELTVRFNEGRVIQKECLF